MMPIRAVSGDDNCDYGALMNDNMKRGLLIVGVAYESRE